MDYILGFITGVLFTPLGLISLGFLGVILEYYEFQVSTVTAMALLVWGLAYNHFVSFDLTNSIIFGVGYLVIGLLWSFWRYKRYLSKKMSVIKNSAALFSDVEKKSMIEKLAPNKNIDRICTWIMVWPFSLIDNAFGDLINSIEYLVKTVFKRVYYRLYESSKNALIIENESE